MTQIEQSPAQVGTTTAILARALAHADAGRVRIIEVPEWGEPAVLDTSGAVITEARPLRLHYSMVSLEDLAEVSDRVGSNWQRQAAFIVAMKSKDDQGNRLFRMIDHVDLFEKAAPDVINRIAIAMLGRTSAEDAEKN